MRIGIDLGGTTLSVGLVNDQSQIVEKIETLSHCEQGADAVIIRISNTIDDLLQKTDSPDIDYIGLGCPGILDRKTGTVIYSNNIKWQQIPICRKLQDRFNVPVYIENDANCAAVGEYFDGAGRGSRQMIMITFGTGIGGGIILDGKLYRGGHDNANIIGHISIDRNGKVCNCKRKGCWECYASTKALLRMAKEAGVFGDLPEQEIRGQVFFEALHRKEEHAIQVFDLYVDYVAEGIATLINILDPERIVIGGGISAQGEILLKPVREKVKQKIYFRNMETSEIICSMLGNDAAIIGAANLMQAQ